MDTCIEWDGYRMPRGYGQLHVAGRTWLAHRHAWVEAHGPIPDGMYVLHRCDNPPCVNVAHLFLGTQADNVADMMAKGRGGGDFGRTNALKSHCPHGHPYDEANTYINDLGHRYCRTCRREHERRRRARLATVTCHGFRVRVDP